MSSKRVKFAFVALFVSVAAVGAVAWKSAAAQAVAAIDSIIHCNSSLPCSGATNWGSGYGILVKSATSDAIKGNIRDGIGQSNGLLAGVAGIDTSHSGFTNGVSGLSQNGNGGYFKTINGLNALIAESDNFNPHIEPHSTVLVLGPNNAVPEVLIGSEGNKSGFPIGDIDSVNGMIFYFTSTGDLHLKGNIFTGGSCSTGCLPIKDAAGTHLTAYAARQPLPTIEDYGQAQLVSGDVWVKIRSDFANTMDPKQPYLVFVTADGPNKGLYVSVKSRDAFEVKENPGGRSTLTFDYRIVARPLDTSEVSRFGDPVPVQHQIEPAVPSTLAHMQK
jgi:hypothetical protein